MSPNSRLCSLHFLLCAVLAGATPAAGDAALPVSPGAAERALEVTSVCPTFSWSGVDGATGYRLAVVDVTDGEHERTVLSRRIDGAALSWTPSLDAALVPGRSYAWFVRAERQGGEDADWSAPHRFRIAHAPSAEELRSALAILERWHRSEAARGAGAPDAAVAPKRGEMVDRGPYPLLVEGAGRVANGVAAIRGEIADVSGNAYGVVGTSASPQGAGVVARNESAGADLILDGEAQGQADTLLTQSGIDRPSASAQTFNLQNSGAGALTLQVEGTAVSLAGHTQAGESISSGTVADARIAATIARDSEVMPIVVASGGEGSGINADYLDGWHAASITNHNHLGQVWSGTDAGLELTLDAAFWWVPAIEGSNSSDLGIGLKGLSSHPDGGFGVWGEVSGTGSAVYGVAYEPGSIAGHFVSWSGNGIYAWGSAAGREESTLWAHNANSAGGTAAYLSNSSPVATAVFSNSSNGEVLYLKNGGTDDNGTGGNDYIRAVNYYENDSQFRVLTNGEVRSDGGFFTPAADFAEMLPGEAGLEPGDVLAIGTTGALVRAVGAHATNVAGVFSTAPGFVGGRPVEGEPLEGFVPLAVVGIVPVKVSAENGAIAPGDLLVSSDTPGHAMRAGAAAPNGTVIGKALEPHGAGFSTIRVLIVLQ